MSTPTVYTEGTFVYMPDRDPGCGCPGIVSAVRGTQSWVAFLGSPEMLVFGGLARAPWLGSRVRLKSGEPRTGVVVGLETGGASGIEVMVRPDDGNESGALRLTPAEIEVLS